MQTDEAWQHDSELNAVQRGVLTELRKAQLRECEKGGCKPKMLGLGGNPTDDVAYEKLMKGYSAAISAAKRAEDMAFDPTYVAQVFVELQDTAAFLLPFPPSNYTNFVAKVTAALDMYEDPCIPKRPVLMYAYMLDTENYAAVCDDFETISRQMHAKCEELFEEQFKEPERLQPSAYAAYAKMKQDGHDMQGYQVDRTQGMTLTDQGNVLLTLFLGRVIEKARDNGPYARFFTFNDGQAVDAMFAEAYAFVCRQQELRLRAFRETIPYTFSEYMTKKVYFPRLLRHMPQSLSELNIRQQDDGKPFCSACKKGYETYYGATAGLFNAERGEQKSDNGHVVSGGNDTGLCVRQLDDLLAEAGLDPATESNNPWYINFVGTWQQAQRRLDAYKKSQQVLYDTNDPRYSWVDYYWRWLLLKVDLEIKRLAGISDVPPTLDLPPPPADPDGESWSAYMWRGLKKLAVFIREASKIALVVLYKVIALVLRSPMTQELLIRGVHAIKEQLCRRMAIESGKVALVKTTETKNKDGTPVLESFNMDTGEWSSLTVAQQKVIVAKESTKTSTYWRDMAFTFFNALTDTNAVGGGWKSFFEGGTLWYGQGIDKFIQMFESIPLVGPILTKVGGVDTIKPVIITTLVAQGDRAWNEMVAANKKLTQLIRLYQAIFMGANDCLTGGKLVIKDGSSLGSTSYYKDAFEHASFNIPYYALMVLNELAYAREHNLDTDEDVIIQNLIRTEVVAAAPMRKQIAEQAQKDAVAMDQWYHAQSLKAGQRDTQGNLQAFNFEGNRIARANARADEQKALQAAWEQKKLLLGAASLFVAAVAATVATGGVAALGTLATGTASAAASAGTAVAGAAASAGTAVAGAAASAGAGTAVAARGAWDRRKQISTAVTKTAGYAVKIVGFAAEHPKATMMAAGLAAQGADVSREYFEHRNDQLKILTVYEVLKQESVRGLYFKTRLRDQIKAFRGTLDETRLPGLKGLLARKKGLVLVWADSPEINVPAVQAFFEHYASPHVQFG